MSARVDPDSQGAALGGAALPLAMLPASVAPIDPDEAWRGGSSLPNDHPAWMRDTLSLSQRARSLLAAVRPVVVRVIAFWEHRVRSIVVAGRTVTVDESGSYRCS